MRSLVNVTVHLPVIDRDLLGRVAYLEDITISELLRRALNAYLSPKYGLLQAAELRQGRPTRIDGGGK